MTRRIVTTVPERGVIDTVLILYFKECGIKPLVSRNFPADAVAVLVYFRIS